MLVITMILAVFVCMLVAVTHVALAPTKRLRGKELRIRDKAFRKDRRERALRNRGPMVDENGNVHVPRHGKSYGRYRMAVSKVKRFTRTGLEKTKAKATRQGLSLERYRLQIRMKEHPNVTMACAVVLFMLYCVVMFHVFGSYGVLPGFAPIAIGAAVSPYELLNTGIVSAEDWAEASGNHTHVEIQNAIDYAKTNGKGGVYIGPGTWITTQPIVFTPIDATTNWDGITFIGSGVTNTTIDISGIVDGVGIEFQCYDQGGGAENTSIREINVTFADMTIDGSSDELEGVRFYYTYFAYIDNIEIINFDKALANGINFHYTSSMTIINMNTWYNHTGIKMFGSYTHTFLGCTSVYNNSIGCSTYFTRTCMFYGCVCEKNVSGFYLSQIGNNTKLRDCYFEGNTGTDIYFTTTQPYPDQYHHCVVDNCSFFGNNFAGTNTIYIHRAHYITIQNCSSWEHSGYFIRVGEAAGSGYFCNDCCLYNNWFGDSTGRTSDTKFLQILSTAIRTRIEHKNIPWNYIDDYRSDTRYIEMNDDNYHKEWNFLPLGDIGDWATSNSGGGGEVNFANDITDATVSAQTNNVTGQWVQMDLGRVFFEIDKFAMADIRLKINDVSECDAYFGFYKDANEYAQFFIDNGDIRGQTNNGGAGYDASSGETMSDGTYLKFRIKLMDSWMGGNPKVWLYAGDELGLSPNNMVTANLMNLRLRFETTSNTDVIPTIDYIKVWQKRT